MPSRLAASLLLLPLAPIAAAAEPTTTIATDPIGLLYGSYSLGVSRAVSSHIVLRADGTMSPSDAPTGERQELAAGAALFLDRAFHGPYVEAGLLARRLAFGGCYAAGVGGLGAIGGCGGSLETLGPQVAVGWQVTFAAGYTLAASVGATRSWTTSPMLGSTLAPTTSVRAGYAW